MLTLLECIFLDVGFLIEDAKLIVSIDKLDTHVVSVLTGHLVVVDEVVHLFLELVDDQIEFVTLIDLLRNDSLLALKLLVLLVKLGLEGVSVVG